VESDGIQAVAGLAHFGAKRLKAGNQSFLIEE
jgi:hypothetical protein